jgi:hypothetical protein
LIFSFISYKKKTNRFYAEDPNLFVIVLILIMKQFKCESTQYGTQWRDAFKQILRPQKCPGRSRSVIRISGFADTGTYLNLMFTGPAPEHWFLRLGDTYMNLIFTGSDPEHWLSDVRYLSVWSKMKGF